MHALDDHRLTIAGIERAARTIDPVFARTPQYVCEPLANALGCRLVVKVETLNPIRSFKGRGPDFFLAELAAAGPLPHLATASAGNFGQGMAYAARRHGASLTIFAARTANPLKVARMRALGAEVVLVGDDFDEAKMEGRARAMTRGWRFVEDSVEPLISEGAGTIGLELTAFPEPLDAVVVPLGNGAMLNGIGRWLRNASPGTEVIAVQAEGATAMVESWLADRVVVHPRVDTIADGIAVRVPAPEALEDMRPLIDDAIVVDDARILEAMRLAHRHLGLVLEPSAGAALAAIAAAPGRFAGRTVAAILCGGNLTPEQMATWLAVEPPAG